jgi:autotransporter-associated beta strand protein
LVLAGGNTITSLSGAGGAVSSVGGAVTLTLSPTGTSVFSGAIQNGTGTLALVMAGAGTEVLAGTNTYSGGTSINLGTLQFALTSAMPTSGTVIVGSGATLGVNVGGPGEFTTGSGTARGSIGGLLTSGQVSWSGSDYLAIDASHAPGGATYSGNIPDAGGGTLGLVALGTGTLHLTGSNTYTGGTSVDGGVLQFAKTSAMPSSGTVSVAGGATLAVNVGGPGEFTTGSGTATGSIGGLLAGISSGTAGAVVWNPGANLGIDATNAPGGAAYSGVIANTNSGASQLGLSVVGTGTVILTGNNSYTGTTTISGGVLQVGNGGSGASIGATSAVLDNGSLVFNHSDLVALAAAVSGAGNVVQEGSGTLLLSGSNSYSGGTTIQRGTLQLGSAAALGTGALAANGGTLDMEGYSATVSSFSGAASVVTNSGGVLATLTTNQTNNVATTFGGKITDGTGQVALNVAGGTLTLSGTNSYTGGTYVDGTAELIVTKSEAIDANEIGTNLYVGNDLPAFGGSLVNYGGAVGAGSGESFGGAVPAAGGPVGVPEPGTMALLAAGAAAAGAAAYGSRRKRAGTRSRSRTT